MHRASVFCPYGRRKTPGIWSTRASPRPFELFQFPCKSSKIYFPKYFPYKPRHVDRLLRVQEGLPFSALGTTSWSNEDWQGLIYPDVCQPTILSTTPKYLARLRSTYLLNTHRQSRRGRNAARQIRFALPQKFRAFLTKRYGRLYRRNGVLS